MLMGALVEAVVTALLLPNEKPPDAAAGAAAGVEVPNEKALDDDVAPAAATGALDPNVNAEVAAAPPAASGAAPGLASSHDMHLTLASALLRVMHLLQSHSPGLALKRSASDGGSEEVATSAEAVAAAALVPKENEEAPVAPEAGGAGAPGLASSHDMHLTLASDLLRVMHLGQSHSPGLALNNSASDGWLDEPDAEVACPFAPDIVDPKPFPMPF